MFQFVRHSLLKRAFPPRGDAEAPSSFEQRIRAAVDYYGWERILQVQEGTASGVNVATVTFDPGIGADEILWLHHAEIRVTPGAGPYTVWTEYTDDVTGTPMALAHAISVVNDEPCPFLGPVVLRKATISGRALAAVGVGNTITLNVRYAVLPSHEYIRGS